MAEVVVRVAPLLRACLDVLRDSSEPVRGREVLERTAQRVSLTTYEQEPIDRGQPRWENHLRWYTGDVATVGWMSKRDGFWSLTEAGETALDAYDEEEFLAELKRRYNEIRRQRANAAKALSNVEQLITRALSVVDPGSWTAYDDLAELVDASTEKMQHFLAGAKRGLAGGYRVLYGNGRLPPEGMRHMDHRGMDLARKLKTEGVEFDDRGQALQTQRMTAADIEQRLAELGDVEPDQSAIRRAWLVKGSSVDSTDLVTVWLQKGTASLASDLRQISPPLPRDELKAIVEQDYQHKSYAVREAKLAEFDAFCNRMRPGDYMLTTSRGQTFVGRITSDATYVRSSDQRSNLRRTVDWLNSTRPVPFGNLPQPLPAKLHSQSDVVELTENITAIESLLNKLSIAIDEPAPAPEREVSFPEITDELATELLIDRSWLQEQTDLLWDRRQVIFYGPPGTGKTFIVRKLAAHLAEPSAVKLVQFHPSYTYEDFFEGFRPVPRKDGQLTFALKPGPFRTLVDAARDHPSDPYILIIDEINRANIAKVFGELYFLLEYRDDAISLLYSGAATDFTLPPNVFVIGTMNTTDRTLALLDAAMRRRFAFVELHPSEPPILGLLTTWLNRLKETTDVAHNLNAPELLDRLNSRIDERDLAIGPSYLMRPEIYRHEDGLNRVWKNSILPLLAEYHYGGPPSLLNRYRLASLLDELAADEDGP
ncbi:MAG: AAA family ATPase [Pseudonocardiaceae bacterium]